MAPWHLQTWVNGSVASKIVLDDLSKGFDTSGDKFSLNLFASFKCVKYNVDGE